MAKSERAKAIILKTTKYGESDLIIQALTSEGERLSLIARSALKSKKRFGGGLLEATRYLNLNYKPSYKQDQLAVLEEAQMIKGFDALRLDYDRLQTAFFVVETANKVSQEGDKSSSALFDLIGNALDVLCELDDLKYFKLHFSLKILHQQGVLDIEEWMKPFVSLPIKNHFQALQHNLDAINLKTEWVLNQLQIYIKTAAH